MLTKVNALCVGLLLAGGVAAADLRGRIDVVDGDTFRVGGQVVRLHGIDAPELDQTCTRKADGQVWACGVWVRDQVRARYQGQRTQCEAVTVDRYERVVAQCFSGGLDVGKTLVEQGLALAYRRYSMAYDLQEKQAFVAGRGLHDSQMQRPAQHRNTPARQDATPDGGCRIKGNISAGGARIFHSPGQADYARTRINTGKGERWFCSAAEARAAGWRAAKR